MARRASAADEARRRRRGRPCAGRTRARRRRRARRLAGRAARARSASGSATVDGDADRRDRQSRATTRRPRPLRCRRPRARGSRGDRLGADAQVVDRSRGHPPQRDRGGVARQVRDATDWSARERELVGAHRARERVARDRRDRSRRSHDDPGLRTAEQLVAGEGHERRAGVDRLADARFVAQPRRPLPRATASVSSSRPEPASTITGGPSARARRPGSTRRSRPCGSSTRGP